MTKWSPATTVPDPLGFSQVIVYVPPPTTTETVPPAEVGKLSALPYTVPTWKFTRRLDGETAGWAPETRRSALDAVFVASVIVTTGFRGPGPGTIRPLVM